MSKKHQPTSQFRPFNRMEVSIAEIMRVNYPLTRGEENNLWMDIVDSLARMFGTKDDRFDSDSFWERCYGEEWEAEQSEAQREADKLAILMDRARAQESGYDPNCATCAHHDNKCVCGHLGAMEVLPSAVIQEEVKE